VKQLAEVVAYSVLWPLLDGMDRRFTFLDSSGCIKQPNLGLYTAYHMKELDTIQIAAFLYWLPYSN
jgi:hypothetical protein